MNTDDIRKLIEQGKLIIGLSQTRRALEAGELSSVVFAANTPEREADAMRGYAQMAGAQVIVLDARNDQLGTICKKPFPIAFCGVKN